MKTKSKIVRSSAQISSRSVASSLTKTSLFKKNSMSNVDTSGVKCTWTVGGHSYRWDVESGVTPDLLLDTGATFLDSDSDDEGDGTPPAQRNRPRFLKSQMERHEVGAETRTRDTQFIAQDYVLFARSRTSVCDHFEKLSDEIILHIFKMLNKSQLARCMATCKRWRRLACDESLWKQIDLCHQTLTGEIIRQVLDRGVIALRLALCQIQGNILEENVSLRQEVPISRLQFLDLSMANMSEDCLAELLSLCVNLRKLSLEQCQVSDLVCRHIANNTYLEVLNMCMCTGITPVGISTITSKCQNLHSWNMAWSHLNSAAVNHLCSSSPTSLRRLNISGCKETLTDEDLTNLSQCCPFLVELDISNCLKLSSGAISILVNGFPSLMHLHASHCYSIAPAQFVSLNKMQYLRHLEVFGILSDAALSALRQSLPRVEVNRHLFSTVARPTTGFRRTSIWGISLH